jgi:8-oxo-dGTP pyrophosphatase MutT (NUDIX family)
MKNHPIKNLETGKIEWVARNIATLTLVKGYNKSGDLCILANVRGPETPDPEFRGCWCMPCGYLDYNETIAEGAAREVFEETGVKISPQYLQLFFINDDPYGDKRQNVTFRYEYEIPTCIENISLTSKNSENGEVSCIQWIPFKEIDNYKWAFNHDKIIKEKIKKESN